MRTSRPRIAADLLTIKPRQRLVVTDDKGKAWRTTARSAPWQVSGVDVLLIEGIAGGYMLSRVSKITTDDQWNRLPDFADRPQARARAEW